tara:strand:- start:58223 stop:59113 length:891 start_codon:yes stop_codon:yes gene_type:complete
MITFDRLRYFVEVATTEHVGNAAKILAISPSVISSAIRELEEEFECQLFARQKQRIKLTERGQVLLEKARGILKETNQLYNDISAENFKFKGHYKVGASHFLMQEYLIPVFLEIQRDHPQLTIEFISLDAGVAVSHLLSGELDAALIFRSSYYNELEETVLYNGQFQIALRKNHPIFKLPSSMISKSLNELPAITFRTFAGPNFWENHPAFKDIGLTPRHAYFYGDTQAALQLLKSTDGWAFLPDKIINKHKSIRKVSLTRVLKAPVNISFVTKKERANKFIDHLKGVLQSKIKKY